MYHLPQPVMRFLEQLADQRVPTGLLFEPFRLPHATGCRLLCTPWTGAPFESIYADEPRTLRQLQLAAGIPETLIELLHLAAEANARILIFDRDAPELDGLTCYRGQWE